MTSAGTSPGTSPLRVAAAQGVSVPRDPSANVAAAVALVREASAEGARVVVLPELFLTGYAPETWRHDDSLVPDDERLAPLAEAASRHGVVVVVGAAVRRALDSSTLSVLVLDAAGRVSAPYDKQHLSGPERDFFTPGDHGASLVVDGWELGLGVCYDGCFPEHAGAATADGALAYLLPVAYYAGAEHRRDLRHAARALDNGIYVVVAGLTGRCGDGDFSGGSAVHDPWGVALDRLGTAPGVVVADLDQAVVDAARAKSPVAAERLPTLGPRRRVAG